MVIVQQAASRNRRRNFRSKEAQGESYCRVDEELLTVGTRVLEGRDVHKLRSAVMNM